MKKRVWARLVWSLLKIPVVPGDFSLRVLTARYRMTATVELRSAGTWMSAESLNSAVDSGPVSQRLWGASVQATVSCRRGLVGYCSLDRVFGVANPPRQAARNPIALMLF